ncbi:MAG: hypothetical protein OXF08_09875 [Bacteroidetes bacterium]|nr:hypothetical protein [Bacteroidota bacterium]
MAIGKFLFRDEAINLPRYFAVVSPRYTKSPGGKYHRGVREWKLWGSDQVRIKENTVKQVRKHIDEEIAKLPEDLQIFFFDKDEIVTL